MTALRIELTRRAGEIGKLLGAKWKELDDEEKKVCIYSRNVLSLHAPVRVCR